MTKQDDIGYTDLLDQQGVPKYDLRVEILGTLDEASSVLGVVRATTSSERTETIILKIQHDLCWMMSELAATTEEARPEIHITAEREEWLAKVMAGLQAEVNKESDFIAPENSSGDSFVQLARAVVGRAERHVTLLKQRGALHNVQIITYLNRLSDLLFVLEQYEDRAEVFK